MVGTLALNKHYPQNQHREDFMSYGASGFDFVNAHGCSVVVALEIHLLMFRNE